MDHLPDCYSVPLHFSNYGEHIVFKTVGIDDFNEAGSPVEDRKDRHIFVRLEDRLEKADMFSINDDLFRSFLGLSMYSPAYTFQAGFPPSLKSSIKASILSFVLESRGLGSSPSMVIMGIPRESRKITSSTAL